MTNQQDTQQLLNKIKENALAIERLKNETDRLLNDFGIPLEHCQTFLTNPNNFSPAVWEELQRQRKILDDQLQKDLVNIKDPAKLKQTFSEKAQIQQHWLFVR